MTEETRAVEYGDDDVFGKKQPENLSERVERDSEVEEEELFGELAEARAAVALTVSARLDAIEQRLDVIAGGVNTIGEMMNNVANSFDQVMQQVKSGGIGALLGSMMGGKKDAS